MDRMLSAGHFFWTRRSPEVYAILNVPLRAAAHLIEGLRCSVELHSGGTM
jgi:hypothetical protein